MIFYDKKDLEKMIAEKDDTLLYLHWGRQNNEQPTLNGLNACGQTAQEVLSAVKETNATSRVVMGLKEEDIWDYAYIRTLEDAKQQHQYLVPNGIYKLPNLEYHSGNMTYKAQAKKGTSSHE